MTDAFDIAKAGSPSLSTCTGRLGAQNLCIGAPGEHLLRRQALRCRVHSVFHRDQRRARSAMNGTSASLTTAATASAFGGTARRTPKPAVVSSSQSISSSRCRPLAPPCGTRRVDAHAVLLSLGDAEVEVAARASATVSSRPPRVMARTSSTGAHAKGDQGSGVADIEDHLHTIIAVLAQQIGIDDGGLVDAALGSASAVLVLRADCRTSHPIRPPTQRSLWT